MPRQSLYTELTKVVPMRHEFSEGDLAFRFTSHRLCLDFLSTIGEVGHRDIERIGTPTSYSRWIAASGILDREPLVSVTDVEDAVEFRRILRSFFSDVTAEIRPPANVIRAINDTSRRPIPWMELADDGYTVSRRAVAPAQAALASVARDALLLVSEGLLPRVKQCNDPTCNMFFLDNSRGNNRIWCSTEGRGCGNKAKKRAFRKRHSEPS
ncbi:CGNR zinc finger domain-containing protein [Sinorhizobium fredii]|nr:CGNR zinc finger domain-containing protein [Sinorhizobium fredii]